MSANCLTQQLVRLPELRGGGDQGSGDADRCWPGAKAWPVRKEVQPRVFQSVFCGIVVF